MDECPQLRGVPDSGVSAIVGCRKSWVFVIQRSPRKPRVDFVCFCFQNQLMQAQRNQELIEEEEYYEFVSTYSLDVRRGGGGFRCLVKYDRGVVCESWFHVLSVA